MTFQKNSPLFDPDFDSSVEGPILVENTSSIEVNSLKVLGIGALVSVLFFCTIGFFVLLFVMF